MRRSIFCSRYDISQTTYTQEHNIRRESRIEDYRTEMEISADIFVISGDANDITQESTGYRIVGTIIARYGSRYKESREILLRPVLPPPFRLPFAYSKRVLHSGASKGFHAARLSPLRPGIEFASSSESRKRERKKKKKVAE